MAEKLISFFSANTLGKTSGHGREQLALLTTHNSFEGLLRLFKLNRDSRILPSSPGLINLRTKENKQHEFN